MNRVKKVIETGQVGKLKSPGQIRRERTEKMLGYLAELDCFGREEMLREFLKESPELSESTFKYRLQKLLKEGRIERVGRNKYCIAGKQKMDYQYGYSQHAKDLALKIVENLPNAEFRIFEPLQIAEIINEGYDSNVVFVSIDANYFVRGAKLLSDFYPGMVLEKPDEEEFNGKIMYERADSWIVLNSLVSEAPRGKTRLWHTDLEKMLVDLLSDKVLRSLWSDSQIGELFETVFDTYHVDESKMLRYARRRKGAERLADFLKENTNIRLRTI